MDTSTITGVRELAVGGTPLPRHTRLVFIASADAPALPSSRHALDDVDEVRFRRGPRRVEREGRVLTLWCPDSRMSSEHGGLIRGPSHWTLDDPSSKNSSVVDGELVRHARLADGAVIELGHSFFLFQDAPVGRIPAHLAGDTDAAHLPAWPAGMATFSPVLARELEALVRFASSAVSLVLCGETGTGKEVIARAVHELSGLGGGFVAVNCGALPAALIEAELFGHRRGAFSGAVSDRRGMVRSAHGGTLFLDEIGELAPASQAALLRVLQEREVLPLGDDRPVAVDVRVIAATLRNLEGAIEQGRFREDLYARLVGHVVTLPPLRERREDLGLLIAALRPATRAGGVPRLTAPALRALLRYDWPRNIRELEQVLATAVALAPGEVIDLEHVPERVLGGGPPRDAAVPRAPAEDALDDHDRELRKELVRLLEVHDGNVLKVAHALGKKRQQIYKWIERFAIDLSAFRRKP